MGIRAAWFWIIWERVHPDHIFLPTQDWMIEHRIWVIVITAGMFGYGVLKFVKIIEEKTVQWLAATFGGLAVISGLLGL